MAEDEQPSYTFRIKAAAKSEIRERLRALFGYEHSTIYPDYPSFAAFAGPHLKSLRFEVSHYRSAREGADLTWSVSAD